VWTFAYNKWRYLGQPQLSLEGALHGHHLLTHHLDKERQKYRKKDRWIEGKKGCQRGIRGVVGTLVLVLALGFTSSKLSKKSRLLTSPLLMSRIRCFKVSTSPVRALFSSLAPSSFVCSPVISRSDDDSDTSSSAMRLASRSNPAVWGLSLSLSWD